MEKLVGFIEEKIAPPLIRFSQMKYIQVIQRTGLAIMPLLIIGSVFLLIASFPIQGYLDFLGDFRWKIAEASGVGTAFIALYTVGTTSYALIEYYNKNKNEKNDILQPMILAIASYLLLNPAQTVSTVIEGVEEPGSFTGVPTTYMGALGVFSAIIIAIVTVELYRFLIRKKITIKLPDNVPPMVANSFSSLIPSAVVIFLWWMFGSVFGLNLPEFISKIFQPLVAVGDTPAAMIITTLLNRLLWSVGIHGGNIVSGVAGTVWTQMVSANQEAMSLGEKLPYIYTSVFSDNYIFTGLVPLAVALLLRKSTRLKAMGGLSLPASLFNIGEPLIFGLPIMLNPLMMIPFVLSSFILTILSIVSVSLNWIPVPVLSVPWITPAPIKAYLSTGGSIAALIFVLIGWIITFLIYYPFVLAMDKAELEGAYSEEGL